jgi:hypothetical protein
MLMFEYIIYVLAAVFLLIFILAIIKFTSAFFFGKDAD